MLDQIDCFEHFNGIAVVLIILEVSKRLVGNTACIPSYLS